MAYTYEEVIAALRNADASGNTEDARRLAEIAASMQEKEKKGNIYAEAARKGVTGYASKVYGAFKGALTGTGQTGARKYAEEGQESMMGLLGGTGAKPSTISEKILATGIESAADPMIYAFPSNTVIQQARPLVKYPLKMMEGLFAGMGSEAGGIAGEYTGRKIGGETGASIGRVSGAMLGGSAGNVMAGSLPRMGVAAKLGYDILKPKIKTILAKAKGAEPIKEAEIAAAKHIENVFIAAAASDPLFIKILDESIEAQNKTGVKIPLSAIMADNPVINSYIAHLASKDDVFKKQYYDQFLAAKEALKSRSTGLFGKPQDANELLARSVSDMDIAGSVARRGNRISRELESTSAGFVRTPKLSFGEKIEAAVESAEVSARAAVNPEYRKAFEIAKLKGIDLPESSVEDIYGFVVGDKASDIFKTFPSIYSKVSTKFAPKVESGTGLVDEFGKPMGKQTESVFKKASIEDLDSLKREVNLQLRKASNDADRRILEGLKGKVIQHINELDPDFVAAYRGADEAFLKKVGLPFNAEGIRMIDRAKFSENVVPILTKNKSTLQQFIDATGNNGKALAEEAFISDFANKVIVDGAINPSKARAWLKINDDALSLVPEVKNRVIKASSDVQDLINAKNALNSKFIKNAQERILQLEGKSAQEIVNNIYSKPGYADKLFGSVNKHLGFSGQQQIGNDGVKAIRSFMLDDLIRHGNPVELLNDRTKAAAFDRVFGHAYSEKIKQLAVIAQRLTNDPSAVPSRFDELSKGYIENLIGMSPERLTSLFVTNPVVSKPVAIVTVLNRFFNKKAGEIAERDMKDILLNPDKASILFKAVAPKTDELRSKELIRSSIALAKKTGIHFSEMLAADIKAGALRSSHGMDMDKTNDEERKKRLEALFE